MTYDIKVSKDAHKVITEFIKAKVDGTGAKGIVIGLSGGLDSSLVAKLAVDAIGKKKVLGLMMPSDDSPRSDLKDATTLAHRLGIRTEVIPIGPKVAAFSKGLKPDKRELANIKSRCRMIVLHQRAMKNKYLVAGTGNKSELLIGYFTKFGDGGVDLLPIGDLYKTQVRLMAKDLGLPQAIIKKPPSAGLWKGQTDEGELGITYEKMDQILFGTERGFLPEDIAKENGIPLKEVLRIEAMIEATSHKRKMPDVPKLGVRTVGIDWRE